MSKRTKEEKVVNFAIEGELSIYRAAELNTILLTQLNDAAELNIDLSGVTDIDTAGVQLLMLLKQEAVRRNKIVSLSHHSNAVINVFEAINVVGQFGDPLLMSSRL